MSNYRGGVERLADLYQEKLERFTAAITADAMGEARKVYQTIQQQSDHALAIAEEEALVETFRYIKSEVELIRIASGRRVSKMAMDNKRALFLRRSEMCEETLALVRERLAEYTGTEAYTEQLRKLTERAVQTFGADTEIYLRGADMPLAKAIAPKRRAPGVTFRQGEFLLGGLQAVCPGKHMQIDESFDTTLAELSGRFAELFGLEMASKTMGPEE